MSFEYFKLWEKENYSNQVVVHEFLTNDQEKQGSNLSSKNFCKFFHNKITLYEDMIDFLSLNTRFIFSGATNYQIKVWQFKSLTICTFLLLNFSSNIHSLQVRRIYLFMIFIFFPFKITLNLILTKKIDFFQNSLILTT